MQNLGTIKSQKLIQNAHSLAKEHNNQQIEPEHLLAAMLSEQESIAKSMLSKLGISPETVAKDVAFAIDNIPKISGGGAGEIYISQKTKDVLDSAFAEASKM